MFNSFNSISENIQFNPSLELEFLCNNLISDNPDQYVFCKISDLIFQFNSELSDQSLKKVVNSIKITYLKYCPGNPSNSKVFLNVLKKVNLILQEKNCQNNISVSCQGALKDPPKENLRTDEYAEGLCHKAIQYLKDGDLNEAEQVFRHAKKLGNVFAGILHTCLVIDQAKYEVPGFLFRVLTKMNDSYGRFGLALCHAGGIGTPANTERAQLLLKEIFNNNKDIERGEPFCFAAIKLLNYL